MNSIEALLDFAKTHVPFHRRRAPENHLVLSKWPLMSKFDLASFPLDESSDLLSQPEQLGGHIVASGGTTSRPKYIFYDHDEAAAVTSNIAKHFLANGLTHGDRVVNFLPSGDMWSSFLMVDRALSLLPVTVFPLGCSGQMDYSSVILERFRPNAIIGISSLLLQFARFCANSDKRRIAMEKVYYAGEAMFPAMTDELQALWGCRLIRSAGYASTDIGSIGWQCLHCNSGEHYAFDDTLVEIIDGEIVVTSLMRKSMPIIRYCTGDRGEWAATTCECAQGAAKFRLCGRADNVILVWGCRLLFDQILSAIQEVRGDVTAIQIAVETGGHNQLLRVNLELPDSLDATVEAQLRDRIYEHCGDLNASMPRSVLDEYLSFAVVPAGTLARNERTGKLTPIVDSRF